MWGPYFVEYRKELVMFGKLKTNRLPFRVKSLSPSRLYRALGLTSFKIRWYPGSASSPATPNRRTKPMQMPPLMVRKAEWRR
jgi:hypothetical protein